MENIRERFISDISLYTKSTTDQHRDMLKRYGLTTNVIFFLAYRTFNTHFPINSNMLDSNKLTTEITANAAVQHLIKRSYERCKDTSFNNMNFTMFRDNCTTAIFQMYYATFNQFALLYNGIIAKYKLRGVLLDITKFIMLSDDRVIYDVYSQMSC